jgi:predicted regulator of Ras-like GTPase activity (Roadblock/LC7/MglB family)
MPTVTSQPSRDSQPHARQGSATPPQAPIDAAGAQALDIRAILRGESLPRGLPGTVADFTGSSGSPKPKPQFTTGPLPPVPQQSGPLGAVPFSAGLLRVIDPRVYRSRTGSLEGVQSAGSALGPAAFQGSAARIESDRSMSDFDATRLVGDFDLPDTGFETHVFSTTELVDGEALLDLDLPGPESTVPLDAIGGDTTERLDDSIFDEQSALSSTAHGVRSYEVPGFSADATYESVTVGSQEPATADVPAPDSVTPDVDAIAAIAGNSETIVFSDESTPSDDVVSGLAQLPGTTQEPGQARPPSVHISPIQQTRADDIMRDLAAAADVVFVRLIAPQGVAMASQGAENGDPALDGYIANALQLALRDADGQGLGEPHYLSIESARAALLVAPVHEGVVLAVYMSNPARLGLLRRQVRKPVLSLRALLLESSVS